ncbi:fimbrial protein [Enterobacter sp. CC120223-11]|uniref:fimbrial protein n=1 Tax=Enterobacter sp. CC120223-11 TaxID=1378073 RepID=UPI000BDD19A4|nr:fimbrial protein [Enterobacter sp. CC120223-11]SNY79833.1 Pilin (type 1 fimbria component protein) [Enterobacter sp. CC120223-11]
MTLVAVVDGTGCSPQQASKKAGQVWLRPLIALLMALPLMESVASSTVTVRVSVIAPPPCVVNGDQPITVEFGEVMTTRVDGNNYKMPVNYSLTCIGGNSNALTLTIAGNATSFDGAALLTDKAGLGVRLLEGSAPYTINNQIKFTYPGKPELYAVPVQQRGATLTGGEFSAAAIMNVAYQ